MKTTFKPIEKKYVGRLDAAEYLGIGLRTLSTRMKNGLNYYRIGGKILFKVSDLDRFIEKGGKND